MGTALNIKTGQVVEIPPTQEIMLEVMNRIAPGKYWYDGKNVVSTEWLAREGEVGGNPVPTTVGKWEQLQQQQGQQSAGTELEPKNEGLEWTFNTGEKTRWTVVSAGSATPSVRTLNKDGSWEDVVGVRSETASPTNQR